MILDPKLARQYVDIKTLSKGLDLAGDVYSNPFMGDNIVAEVSHYLVRERDGILDCECKAFQHHVAPKEHANGKAKVCKHVAATSLVVPRIYALLYIPKEEQSRWYLDMRQRWLLFYAQELIEGPDRADAVAAIAGKSKRLRSRDQSLVIDAAASATGAS